jgi:signal transduction histidine kinase
MSASLTVASITAFAFLIGETPKNHQIKVILIYLPMFFVSLISFFPPLLHSSVEIIDGKLIRSPGSLYHVWVITIILYIVLSLYFFIIRFKNAPLVHNKRQIGIIGMGIIIASITLFLSTNVLPIVFDYHDLFHPGVIVSAIFAIVSMYYAVVSKRLPDLEAMLLNILFWAIIIVIAWGGNILFFGLFEHRLAQFDIFTKGFFYTIAFIIFYYMFRCIHTKLKELFEKKKTDLYLIVENFAKESLLINGKQVLAENTINNIGNALCVSGIKIFERGLDSFINIPDLSDYFTLDKLIIRFFENSDETLEYETIFIDPSLKPLQTKMRKYYEFNQIEAVVPLVFKNSLIGLIHIPPKSESKKYSIGEIEFLDKIKTIIAVALNNCKTYDSLEGMVTLKTQELTRQNLALEYSLQANERDMHIFKSINEFSRLLVSINYYGLSDFYKSLADIFPGFIGIKTAAVFEFNKTNKQFKYIHSNSTSTKRAPFPLVIEFDRKNIISKSVASKQSLIIYDTQTDNEFSAKQFEELNITKTAIIIPLICTNEVKAVLCFIDKVDEGEFDKYDFYFINTVSHLINLSIEKIKSFEERIASERLASIGQMAANIVHDIKNPIASIKGFAECFTSPEFGDNERREFANIIIEESNRLLDMTSEVLQFSRGEITIHPKSVNLDKFLDDVYKYLNGMFLTKNINLAINTEYKGKIKIDPDKLKRVFYNIAHNAYEAMDENGSFEINIKRDGKARLLISLSDNGPGIPEEIREEIFTAFASFGKPGGTGLGMAIAKSFVDAHGGEIYFETENNKGTTFYINLPLK